MECHSRREDKKPFSGWEGIKIKLLFMDSAFIATQLFIIRSSIKESENGVVLVYMCLLMPLILTATIFVYVGTTQLEISSTLHQICRTELLAIQGKFSHHLQEKIEPVSLSNKSQDRSAIDLEVVKRRVKESLLDFKNKTRFLMNISAVEVISIVSPLDPQDTNQNRLSPRSLTSQKNSLRSQQFSLYWRYQIQLTSTLLLFNHWQSFFYGQCATALAKEKPWKPVLIEVKPFWKSS